MALAVVVVLLAAAAPSLVRTYWSMRSSNTVRRGVTRARQLNCFSCHGELGRGGLPDPTATSGEVPSWSGGSWMMYVDNDVQISQYILDGVSQTRRESESARAERERATIHMPAYREFLSGSDLDDLLGAFKVLSRMALPRAETPERRGLELAERWGCFGCHGPAGSGGAPNPGSFSGFIPGWYGADFRDLVSDRGEFDSWVREGSIPRLTGHRVASYFIRRQRVTMPAYAGLSDAELDDLWAYVQWLARTDGGHLGVEQPW